MKVGAAVAHAADQNAATDEEEQLHLIQKKASAEVSRWRGMVIMMLSFTARLVITTTYLFLSRKETDEFEKLIPGNIGGIWENCAQGYQGWLEESQELVYQTSAWYEDPIKSAGLKLMGEVPPITEKMCRLDENLEPVTNYSTALYAPAWQISPTPFEPSLVNYDLLSNPTFQQMFNFLTAGQVGLSAFFDPSFTDVLFEGAYTQKAHAATHDQVQGGEEGLKFQPNEQPHTVVVTPIRSNFGPEGVLVGLLLAVLLCDKFLSGQLPKGVNGVCVVITNTCDQAFTYIVNGPIAVYVGPGDVHQTDYDYLEEKIDLYDIKIQSNVAADSCGM